MSRRDEEIEQAFANGVVGFSGKITTLAGNPLINVQLPEHLSVGWTVTLMAMKNGDTASPKGLVGGIPPDVQIATALFPSSGQTPPERQAYNIEGVYLVVSWGAGFARERAFISYPFGGGSFQVHGASVRVETPGGLQSAGTGVSGEGIPIVGGFLSQSERSQSDIPPVLLTSLRDIGDAGPIDVWAPPRAIGYRLWTITDLDSVAIFPTASAVLKVQQLTWLAGAAVAFTLDGTNVTAYRGNSNELDVSGSNAWQRATRNASDWTRLVQRSIGVRITNVNADEAAAAIGVEWILDLG